MFYTSGMYIRPCYRDKNGKRHAYWVLVESMRTSRGPRQRVVAYVGLMEERQRLGVKQAAERRQDRQGQLFNDVEPEYVEIDSKRIRVTRCRDFGGPWLGRELIRHLGLDGFFRETVFKGREQIPWAAMCEVLVLSRLCHPSSELHIAEHAYRHSALEDLLGVPNGRINEDRLYRAMDNLLPHKESVERFLKEKLGTLFDLDYDLVLYDVTSTYFEGESGGGSLGKRGYSRDHRPDCRQVCIGLVVSRCGIPLGYELFAGNRSDVTTLQEIVEMMERRYGKAHRIWVLDRGMISEENIEFLKEGKRRYLVGTPRGMLKKFERDLLGEDWQSVRDGLEVKRCSSPDGQESFILCRSRDRTEKEKAMHRRFEKRIEEELEKIQRSCQKRKCRPGPIERRVGKLLGRNSRAAGLFQVHVTGSDKSGAKIRWEKIEAWRELSITHKSRPFYRRASCLNSSMFVSTSCSMSFRSRA